MTPATSGRSRSLAFLALRGRFSRSIPDRRRTLFLVTGAAATGWIGWSGHVLTLPLTMLFPALWAWRQRFLTLPGVASTCDAAAWRHDYFGALFPLNPGGIVPDGPSLSTLVNRPIPQP